MAWRRENDLMAGESVEEELQEVLPGPPKPAARRWGAWLGLVTGSLALVGFVLVGTGALTPQRGPSALERISMVHDSINIMVKAATEEGDFSTKIEAVVDNYANKDSPPTAMGVHAVMKVGGEGKRPKIVKTILSKPGKAADLKRKLTEIKESLCDAMHGKEKEEFEKAVEINVGEGDAVLFEVTPPQKKIQEEDADLKAAIKEHKPVFHAHLNLGSTFEYIHANDGKSLPLAIRAIEAKLEAVFANSIFKMLTPMLGPQQAAGFEALRMLRSRNELFYSSEEELLEALPPLPTVEDTMNGLSDALNRKMPASVLKSLKGIDAVMAGVSKVTLEGLPYDWEIVADFHDFNPAPAIEEHFALP